jgi:hypothetical protein
MPVFEALCCQEMLTPKLDAGTQLAWQRVVMPGISPRTERRKARTGLKVIHRHRVGTVVVRRVSELVFVKGRPIALLEWINLGGVRTPLYVCELDAAKLTQTDKTTYLYEGVTVDPRFEK